MGTHPLIRTAPGLGTERPLWVHAPAPTEAPRATGTDYATSLMALSFALSFANVVARIEWYERPLHAGEHVLSPSNPVIPEVIATRDRLAVARLTSGGASRPVSLPMSDGENSGPP